MTAYTPLGGEFLVNSATLNNQFEPTITGLVGGGFVVSWSDGSSGNPNSYDVKAQIFASDGSPVGGEFLVNNVTLSSVTAPTITGIAGGGFVISWTDASLTNGYSNGYDIRAQIFASDGSPVGGEFLVNSTISWHQELPTITGLAGGGFVISWWDFSGTGGDSTGSGIRAQIFAPDGSPIGSEFLVNAVTSNYQEFPAVTGLTGGGFVISWLDRSGIGGDSSGSGIKAQIFAPDGSPVGGEFLVNSVTANDQVDPTITGLDGGGFVISWQTWNEPGTEIDIKAQIFALDGSPVGGEFLVNDVTLANLTAPTITGIDGGGFVISWVASYGMGADSSEFGIHAQVFAPDGSPVGDQFLVNEATYNGQIQPTITRLDGGGFVVSWTDNSGTGGDPSGYGIKAQMFTPDNLAPTDIALSAAAVDENSADGTVVGALSATDGDAGDSLAYSLVDDAGGRFAINGDQLVVADGALLDYETATSHSVIVRVTDSGGLTYDETFAIAVGDVADGNLIGYEPQGTEFLVNSTTASDQYNPSITALSDGGFVVSWMSLSQDGSGFGVYAQRYAADGTAAGGEFLVNSTTASDQIEPSITALADGGFVVSWISWGQDGSNWGVYAQRYAADGTAAGGEFRVNSTTASNQYNPSITALADGGFVVSWNSYAQDGDWWGVYAQRYAADGTAAGGEFRVNSTTASDQDTPSITALADGGFVVSWSSLGQDGSGYGVYAQRYAADGTAAGGEFRVNSTTASHQYSPSITALADGGFVVSWNSYAQDGDFWGVYAQRYAADGTASGVEFRVNSTTASSQESPSITALADGGFVVSWASVSQDGDGYGIYAQRYAGGDSNAPPAAPMDSDSTGDSATASATIYEDHAVGAAIGLTASSTDPDAGDTVSYSLGFDGGGNPILDDGQFAINPSTGVVTLSAALDYESASSQTLRIYATDDQGESSYTDFTVTVSNAIEGTPGNDSLSGTGAPDHIYGYGGNDRLVGNGGDDALYGGDGADYITGSNGDDVIDGGDGADRAGWYQTNAALGGATADLTVSGPQNTGSQGWDTLVSIEYLSGTPFADTFIGDDNDNILWGSAATISAGNVSTTNNDYLDGAGGNDLLTIGLGNHTIIGGGGNDTLSFTENGSAEPAIFVQLFSQGAAQDTGAGNWTLTGIENVFGGVGDDDLEGDSNANILGGSLGADFLFGYGGNDTLYGDGYITTINNVVTTFVDSGNEGGNDQLFGGAGDDSLYGGAGNDSLRGGADNDMLYGGIGDDLIVGGFGDDVVDGGDGYDRAGNYHTDEALGGVTVDLNIVGAQDTGSQGWDTLTSIEYVSGTPFADTLIGDANDNILWGSPATIDPGSNWVSTSNNDTLDGGDGNDLLAVGIGNHSLTGGNDIDTVSFTENFGDDPAIQISLALQGAAQDTGQGLWTLNGIENLSGGDDDDQLTGDDNANILAGSFGNDTLSGGGGNDSLYGDGAIDSGAPASGPPTLFPDVGANGNDILEGGEGNDVINGGGGSDTASYANASGAVQVALNNNTNGNGSSSGADGNDSLFSIENITGSGFADTITGSAAGNVIIGGDGNDFMQARGGDDTVYGGNGNDYLGGGTGNDYLDGGVGWDRASFSNGSTGPVTVDLRIQGVAQNTGLGMDTLVGIENLTGTAFGDTLTGDDGDNWLWGGSDGFGDDTIDGQGGNDLIENGVGNHVLSGGTGIDTFLFNPFTVPTNATISLALQGVAQDTGAGIMTLTGFENLAGSDFADTLIGDDGANVLAGAGGSDALVGGAGNDTLYGDGLIWTEGSPSGQIVTYPDVATLGWIGGDDTLEGGLGDDQLWGGGGNDTASYANAGGAVTVGVYNSGFGEANGADGYDQLHEIENIVGSAFNDGLGGNNQNNILWGGAGNDSLRGNAGDDQMYGEGGNDFLGNGAGDDLIDGGSGFDRVSHYTGATAGVTVDLRQQGVAQDTGQGNDTLIGIEHVSGTLFADTLTGDDGDNWIWGSPATLPDGTIAATNNDVLDGQGGNDLLVVGIGNHSIDGGSDSDTLAFTENANNDPAVTISLALQGVAQVTGQGSWTVTNVENLSGGTGNDALTGDGNANVLAGYTGNDTLVGGAGNDQLYGDGLFTADTRPTLGSGPISLFTDATQYDPALVDGNDILEGGLGNDTLDGGGGTDTASYANASGNVNVNLGTGTAFGADGNDILVSIENAIGSEFGDTLNGSASDNLLSGLGGNDVIQGQDGHDTIHGGDGDDTLRGDLGDNFIGFGGNDVIYGGNGNDGLRGGLGDDQLYGGANNDLLRGNGGVDYFDGGADDGEGVNGIGDRVSFYEQRATQGAVADLRTGIISNDGFGNVETMVGIESLGGGTAYADTFYGNDGRNYLFADIGDDVYGFGGDDIVQMATAAAIADGGDGSDRLLLLASGGWLMPDIDADGLAELAAEATAGWMVNLAAGTTTDGYGNSGTVSGIENVDGSVLGDSITGDANANILNGLDGDDTLEGGLGNDTLDGGTGVDTASYANAGGGVNVNLGTGFASGADGNDTLVGIENIVGSAFNDFLTGNGLENVLTGGDGRDDLRGQGGNDTLLAGNGNDFLVGGLGDDVIDGEAGFDRVSFYSDATTGITVDLNLQGVAQNTGQGMDTLIGIENVSGTRFADLLTGDNGDNWLWGSGASLGGIIVSATNDDTIDGGGGNDLLVVGIGNHVLIGGSGIDTVRFTENGQSTEIGMAVSLASQGIAQATGNGSWTLTAIENLSGGTADDTLTGDSGANVLAGDLGNDVLSGGGGNDMLYGDGQIGIDFQGGGGSGPITTFTDVSVTFGGVAGNDILEGGLGDDVIDGGGGTDTASYANASGSVNVNLGTGFASGADGNDTLVNIENVIGSQFNDAITGNGESNVLDGLGGNDGISGGAGDDTIFGGDGDDFLQGDFGENNISVTGNDILNGGNGNDGLRGGLGDDQLYGGANNDLLRGNGGVDYFDGGADDGLGFNGIGDRISFFDRRATQGAIADLRTGIISNDGFGNVETMVGIESLGADTAYVDTFYGDDNRNFLGGSRGDNLYGFGGDDQFQIGAAVAVLDGGSGTDLLGLDSSGGWLLVDANADGLAESAAAATSGWTVNLAAGTIFDGQGNTGTVTGIENVNGSFLGDTLIGDGNANVLNGFDGDDLIEGRSGDDVIDGGNGTDTASYANAGGSVTVNLGTGFASGADGNDTLVSIENIVGSAFNDTITGNGGNNSLFGGVGNDVINGDGGDDTLVGGAGIDTLDGGAGIDTIDYSTSSIGVTVNLTSGKGKDGDADGDTISNVENIIGSSLADKLTGNSFSNVLNGGGGNDIIAGAGGGDMLFGGAGMDKFLFNALADFGTAGNTDQIMDFDAGGSTAGSGVDLIDLSAIDANSKTANKDDAFTFIGAGQFSNKAGELRYDAPTSTLSGDVNGDGIADFSLSIIVLGTFDSSDILL